MEFLDLKNKIVKVNNVDDLLFYYPNYKVKQFVNSLDMGDNIIYTGVFNKRAQQILEYGNYIATQGLYTYDFTDREFKVKFVYSKWDREVPSNILESIDYYDDIEFDYCCKTYWICGRWPYKQEHESSMYTLYQSSVNSITEFINQFLETALVYPIGVIEQSFFTFMLRSKAVDEQNVKPQYKRLLKSFNNVSGSKIRSAVVNFIESPIEDRELRFIEFIYALRG